MKVIHCRVNELCAPFLDTAPRISWQVESDRRGCRQAAYRIRVWKETQDALVYDTGSVPDSSCLPVTIPAAIEPLTKYLYQVDVRNQWGECASSGIQHFWGAKRGQAFQAKWITGHFCRRRDDVLGAVYMRRPFTAPAGTKRALLVICGLGYFEATLNSTKVGDDFLSTPFTAYHKQVQYRVFDVTELLQSGDNVLGVTLGNGFYNCFTDDPWQTKQAIWRDVPKLLCELHITDGNGHTQVIVSDDTWRTSTGPIVFNGLRHGETYDARLQQPGWDSPGFDEKAYDTWGDAKRTRAPGGLLRVLEMEPVRVFRRITPIAKWKTPGGWILDAGVLQSGICRFTFHGKAGDTLTMRYSDLINDDGSLDTKSLSGFIKNYDFQTDRYIKHSNEPETWHTTFAYHGFRYVEISGNDWEPELEDVEVWSLCNDFADRGMLITSDDMINKIQEITLNAVRSVCFYSIAADTAREKISWTGDTGLSAGQMLLNFDSQPLLRKWMQDMRDAQLPSGMLPCIIPTTGWGFTFANGPDWSQPMHIIPGHLYTQCGDVQALEDNYDAHRRYVQFLDTMAVNHILDFGLGDWCAPFEGPALSVNMESFKCPVPLSDTAFYYKAVCDLAHSARVLGKAEDARAHAAHAANIRKAFRERFYDKNAHTVHGQCQTALGLTIAFGLCDKDEVPHLIEKLLEQIKQDNDRLDFGVLGARAVLTALGQNGHAQVGLDLLTAPTYPSMADWINRGATTLWECWNGLGSRNHHMFSSVSEFFYRYVAGIRPAPGTAAYETTVFEPMLQGTLRSAQAAIRTVRGKVGIRWSKTDAGFEVIIQVPVSCMGELVLPGTYAGQPTLPRLTEGGAPVQQVAAVCTAPAGQLRLTVPSGTYTFTCL